MDAYSNAGTEFGQGAGDALVQYMENKQYDKALGNIKSDTPITEAIKIMAQNNVSATKQNQWLSQAVQSGISRERAKENSELLGKMTEEELQAMTVPELISKILGIGIDAPAIVEPALKAAGEIRKKPLYTGGKRSQGRGTANPTLRQQDMQPASEQAGKSPEGYSPYYQSDNGAGMLGQGQDQGNALPLPGINPPPQETNQGRGFQNTPDLQADIAEGYDLGADTFDTALQYANAKQLNRQNIDQQEKNEESEFLTRLKKRYPDVKDDEGRLQPGIDPALEAFGTELFRYETGTANERSEKTINALSQINNHAQNVENAEKFNWFKSLLRQDPESFYKNLGSSVKRMLHVKGVPAAVQPGLINYARQILSDRPDLKEVGVERVMQEALNQPNYNKEIASLKKIPNMSNIQLPTFSGTTGGSGGAIKYQKSVEKREKEWYDNKPKVVDYLVKTLTNDSLASPILIRNELLDKNYSEQQIKEAFNDAAQQGWIPSWYQDAQYTGLNVPQNQTPTGVLHGNKARRGFAEQAFGVQ